MLLSALSLALLLVQAAKPYEVLPDTRSPDGRYAAAWGFHGRTDVDFARMHTDDAYYVAAVSSADVEDYIVDLRTGRKVCLLRDYDYFPRENHGSLTVRWMPGAPVAIIEHGGKWVPRSVVAVRLPGRASGSQVEMLNQIRSDVFRYLDRHGGTAYRRVKGEIALDMRIEPVTRGRRLPVRVQAHIPKAENGWWFYGVATYALRPSASTVRSTLLSIRRTPPPPDE